MTEQPTTDAIPDAVVAVYENEADVTAAIKHLEHEHYDMTHISVLGRGMTEERHVVGFETQASHTARWAKWGGLWGWVFGAFFLVPGVGHVAIGGYLLYVLATAGFGAAGGALAGGLTAVGIPKDGVPKYEADLRADRLLIIAHGTTGEVAKAKALLDQTRHQQLDHHTGGQTSTTNEPGPSVST
jgi:uncharacterized membrane protein